MKLTYDSETDALYVSFRKVPIAESEEHAPGFIFDYDAAGNIVSIEVLDASKRVDHPDRAPIFNDK